ncbi:hypothetical protein [Microcoleus sp. bin38.metabat.b11b12b14.051]|uniref:hypothetical protein n=1 Tax=Microcoleus sp. bin38.metabat.b11b12b14.051 TaxID=2742709 RepID=UPI0025EDAB02|nr:hypothetical protein [Microcoleus sp. bin38.metabat.b11b12b14.051]
MTKAPKLYSCSQAVRKVQMLVPKKKRHILILDTMTDFMYVTFTPPGTYAGKLTQDEINQVAEKLNSF